MASAVLCGVRLPRGGGRTLAFEAFGFVEGVLALLALFLFLRQGALAPPVHWMERAALAYWLAATAVLMRLALPPPGLGYWLGAALFAFAMLGAFGGGDRRRTLFTLGVAVALSGTLRFAVIPFVWRNASLPDFGPLELGGISDWAKGLVTEYEPVREGNEVLNVLGIALYALALWRVWPAAGPDPIAALSADERERLWAALLSRLPGRELPAALPPAAEPRRRKPLGASLVLGHEPPPEPPSDPEDPAWPPVEPPPGPARPGDALGSP